MNNLVSYSGMPLLKQSARQQSTDQTVHNFRILFKANGKMQKKASILFIVNVRGGEWSSEK